MQLERIYMEKFPNISGSSFFHKGLPERYKMVKIINHNTLENQLDGTFINQYSNCLTELDVTCKKKITG